MHTRIGSRLFCVRFFNHEAHNGEKLSQKYPLRCNMRHCSLSTSRKMHRKFLHSRENRGGANGAKPDFDPQPVSVILSRSGRVTRHSGLGSFQETKAALKRFLDFDFLPGRDIDVPLDSPAVRCFQHYFVKCGHPLFDEKKGNGRCPVSKVRF